MDRSPEQVAGPAPGEHVIFDLGGVLLDWNPRHLFSGRLGAAPSAVERFLTEVCSPEWHRELDLGAPFATHTKALAERFPEHGEWIGRYGSHWDGMFRGTFPAPVAVLEMLYERGCRLHALSNYPGEKIAFLYRSFPFMRLFETVVISGLVGVAKPDPAIFEYLRRLLGEGRCWFIDDRPENVAAARSCGFRSLRFAAREHPDLASALAAES